MERGVGKGKLGKITEGASSRDPRSYDVYLAEEFDVSCSSNPGDQSNRFVDHNSDDDVKVSGMMHLLISGYSERKESMYQTLEDVYSNFTSIQKVAVALLDDLLTNHPENTKYVRLRKETGFLVTFCRFKLKRIFRDDGITINACLADLLAEIELHLLDLIEECTNKNVSERVRFCLMEDMMERIGEAYFEPSPICYLLNINYDMMVEFLEDFGRSLDKYKYLKENFNLVVSYYLKLQTKDRIHGDNLETLLIAVENVAYVMSSYIFVAEMYNLRLRQLYCGSDYSSKEYQSGFRFGVLKALVLLSDRVSSYAPVTSDELVIGYVKCVQDNLLELLMSKAVDLTDALQGKLKILHEELSFLLHFLVTCPLKHNFKEEKLSHIRLDFEALVRNLGSVICSCFDSPKIEEISLALFDLIEKANVIKGDIIKTASCMYLRETEQKSPEKGQLGSLFLLLQNLKEFMDGNPGLIVTWKDHENLVPFIFYLIQNYGDPICDDLLSINTLHLDIPLTNHEALKRVLVSAQIVAFNMASYSLLKRYGRFRWWELYLGTKEHVNMHMCVGILKAIVLSSPLTDELLIAYGECIKDSLIELLRDEAIDVVKDQIKILHERFSFLWRFLTSYRDEKDKLSDIILGCQDLVRSLASVICLHFYKRVHNDTLMKQATPELPNLIEKIDLIIVQTEELVHLVHLSKIGRESPKTNQLGSLNLLLEYWKGLMQCESGLTTPSEMIYEKLGLFKSLITSNSTEDDESKILCSSIMDAVYVAEYLLATFSVGIFPVRSTSHWIPEFTEHAERIKAAAMELSKKNGDWKVIGIARKERSAKALLVPASTDVVVGFMVEMKLIRGRLFSHLKKLDVISIIGMPGLGKTTLARKVYEDTKPLKHFDVHAWCCVSQEYSMKELLLTILGSITDLSSETREKSESELSLMVHKQLTGRRYFIVLDDIWDINVLMDLKCFFPDDNQGSRIVLTSRSKVIGSQAQCRSDLIEPNYLTEEQSWDLFERKVFNEGKCPPELCQIGNEIATKCKGLPLAVVVVGGVLATGTQTRDYWEQVMGNLSSYFALDAQSHIMGALELSYEFLPDYLKPMFLYFGAFSEDKEIHADKLMLLWMAEGFVQNTKSMSLEIQAEMNLMDLIDRSLVMVAKRRSDGRVRSCHVHDLLREMCLSKAKEEKFMQQVHVRSDFPDLKIYQQGLSISLKDNDVATPSMYLSAYKDLTIFSITPPIYSLLIYPALRYNQRIELTPEGMWDFEPVISSLKLLKVFDAGLFKITGDVLVKDLIKFAHLKYLSFFADFRRLPPSISELQSLETLIIKSGKKYNAIVLPESIWKMKKLRHLYIKEARFSALPEKPFILENLNTLSTIRIYTEWEEGDIFRRLPGLKKLKCEIKRMRFSGDIKRDRSFMSLGKLESLTASGPLIGTMGQLQLPLTLKKLSILLLNMRWSEISVFHTLPNLEVLKLKNRSVVGECWDMGDDDVFTKLKYLKLDRVDIKRWSASSVNFPRLEKLVLEWCNELEEIPSDLGEIYTLQEIEVNRCGSSVVNMAKEIQKQHEDFGNELLVVNIKTWIGSNNAT